jgi:hypothetical protein
MKALAQITVLFYIAAIVVAGTSVYYINIVYNPPQPTVSVTYNALASAGSGFILNTLPFPIQITTIYCTIPKGEKLVFGSPNNNTLASGSKTIIEIATNNRTTGLPANCGDLKVGYIQVSESQVANRESNSPFEVFPQ